MDWARDLDDWPLHEISRRVMHKPHQWHVQETGTGETLLLLHGAGASTHTWRDVIPVLAQSYHVVALDMPGQGFTRAGSKSRCGMRFITEDIASLCDAEGWQPTAIIGHSAGAAVALSIADLLSQRKSPVPAVIGLNAALDRFEGIAGWLFPLLAKMLALNPLTSLAFSMGKSHMPRARRLIDSTGSTISDEGISYYARLIADRDHVEGTLQMMAQWNIDALTKRFDHIKTPCLLMTGERDKTVPPAVSARACKHLINGQLLNLPNLGHLAHEENPKQVCDQILHWLKDL